MEQDSPLIDDAEVCTDTYPTTDILVGDWVSFWKYLDTRSTEYANKYSAPVGQVVDVKRINHMGRDLFLTMKLPRTLRSTFTFKKHKIGLVLKWVNKVI
jgi:hypothetical protein